MALDKWASDASYAAGTDPWSGQPTKVTPSGATITAGHIPGVPVPAETENWWKNRTDGRLDVLDGQRWKWYGFVGAQDFTPSPGFSNGYLEAVGAVRVLRGFDVGLYVGQTILGAKVKAKGVNAGAGNFISGSLLFYDAFTNIGEIQFSYEDTAAAGTVVIDGVITTPASGPIVPPDGTSVHIDINMSTAGQRLYSVGLLIAGPS